MGIDYDNCIDFVTNASVTLNEADLPILTYIIHVFKFTIKYSIVPNVVTTRDLYLIIQAFTKTLAHTQTTIIAADTTTTVARFNIKERNTALLTTTVLL